MRRRRAAQLMRVLRRRPSSRLRCDWNRALPLSIESFHARRALRCTGGGRCAARGWRGRARRTGFARSDAISSARPPRGSGGLHGRRRTQQRGRVCRLECRLAHGRSGGYRDGAENRARRRPRRASAPTAIQRSADRGRRHSAQLSTPTPRQTPIDWTRIALTAYILSEPVDHPALSPCRRESCPPPPPPAVTHQLGLAASPRARR